MFQERKTFWIDCLKIISSTEPLVIKPLFRENGFFRNNREVLIWLTDDENRVPVRVEVTTPVGRVVAELVSSERVSRSDDN